MTVIRPNSISGINSITAQSNALAFYDVAGNKLNIDSDITGDVTVATGATISGSTNTITASTNGSERVRIDSTGNVGIGTNSADNLLTIVGDHQGFVDDSAQPQATLLIKHGTTGSNRRWIGIGASTTGAWIQSSSPGGSGLAAPLSINPGGGNIGIGTDNPGAKLHVSGGNIKVDDGYGIDFSATADGSGTTSSELLDDYEEGTFTPNLDVSGASGTLSIGYSNQTGRYVKVGRIVHFSIDIRLSSWSRGTGIGGIMVKGLPFVPVNSANYSRATGFCNLYNWDYSADSADIPMWTVYQASNQPWVDISKHREANTNSDISDPGSTSMIFFSGTYEAGA